MTYCKSVESQEVTIGGAGCLLSIPVAIAVGFKFALKYAQAKEHQFSHQVEEVELEGVAALQVDEGQDPKESLQRFVKKLERVTEQFGKMGGRFSATDFESQKTRLENLKGRLKEPDAESQTLILEAERSLMQYAPDRA